MMIDNRKGRSGYWACTMIEQVLWGAAGSGLKTPDPAEKTIMEKSASLGWKSACDSKFNFNKKEKKEINVNYNKHLFHIYKTVLSIRSLCSSESRCLPGRRWHRRCSATISCGARRRWLWALHYPIGFGNWVFGWHPVWDYLSVNPPRTMFVG